MIPLSASLHPHFCPLSHHPRKICFHLNREAPDDPRSYSKNLVVLESGVQDRLGLAVYMGGATGPECRGSEAGALWQDLGVLGATQALQGRASALRQAGVAGAEARRVGNCDVRWPIFSQHQAAASGWPEEAHPPPAPRSVARLRRPGNPRPRDHISYMIFGADTTARRCCQHARTTASEKRVLFIWVSLAHGLAEVSLWPGGAP